MTETKNGFEFVCLKTKKKTVFSLEELRLIVQACQYLAVKDYEANRKKNLYCITKKLNSLQGWSK